MIFKTAKARYLRPAQLLILVLGLQANGASAEVITPHPHSDIILSAQTFLSNNIDPQAYSRIDIKMGQLDSRLRLAQCSTPLDTSLAPGSNFSGKATVHVKCSGSTPWTVFINANIRLFAEVIHTAEPLPRGHILGKHDLLSIESDLSQLRSGYYSKPEQLVGLQLKRRLPQHKIIKVNYVKPPTLIKRGEIVSIVAKNQGYSVKMSGTALMNGVRGERIRVKNLSSKRIIEGTVKAAGVVSIN